MASFVLKILSLVLGIFFVFIGTLKLTPSVNQDLYKEMRKTFIRSTKVFPLVKQTGWKPNPHTYRKAVGGAEVVCGVILAAVPGPLKEASNVLLMLLMANDIYAHYALNDGMEKMSLQIVMVLLLTCRLIIHLQIKAREIDEAHAKETEEARLLEEKKEE
ncbi:hypothetical protein KUTeg_006681 [Tegillarca granosa]|uniref:Novel acetylcholine receptor chaperone n=1 Tax=Tegillarca granosa TaxID=220873 RepID=A0ABQ9FE82_TEGGR|nr:hypothetical protein KUTeg_006681 [Tegillarca granosa]